MLTVFPGLFLLLMLIGKNSDPLQKDYAEALANFEQAYFQKLLEHGDGNVEAAARKAGVNLATIYQKIKKYDLRS